MLAVAIQTVILSAAIAWIATPLVIRLAARVGALDRPGSRKVHTTPIPRLGGIAVFFGFIGGVAFAELHNMAPTLGLLRPSVYWAMVAGASALFVLGAIDDIFSVGFIGKFVVQLAAAVVVWSAGFRIEQVALGSTAHLWHLGWLSLPATVLWIVGVTNAVNLIDGLDGLAAGTALITTSAVAAMALLSEQTGVVAASAALVGALAGFLPYNFNPARIFLGDSGSMFLGFVLAVISIRSSQKGPTTVAALAPLLVIGLPILDTGFAILRRSWRIGYGGYRAKSSIRYVASNLSGIFLPDRGHIHHKLLELGLSHRRAVLALYGFATILAAAAVLDVISNSPMVALLLVLVLAGVVAALAVAYHLVRRRSPSAPAPAPATEDPLPVPGRARQSG